MDKTLQKMVLTSILAAMAVALGILVKVVPGLNISFPEGGNVFGLYTLPIVLIGMILGVHYGIAGGVVYGLVSLLLDGAIYHWGSVFLDYIIPFGLMGLAGALFRKKALNNIPHFILTFVVSFLFRWISHGLSGVLIFAEYAGSHNPWFYSFILYNLPYVLSSSAIACVIGLAIRPQLSKLTERYN